MRLERDADAQVAERGGEPSQHLDRRGRCRPRGRRCGTGRAGRRRRRARGGSRGRRRPRRARRGRAACSAGETRPLLLPRPPDRVRRRQADLEVEPARLGPAAERGQPRRGRVRGRSTRARGTGRRRSRAPGRSRAWPRARARGGRWCSGRTRSAPSSPRAPEDRPAGRPAKHRRRSSRAGRTRRSSGTGGRSRTQGSQACRRAGRRSFPTHRSHHADTLASRRRPGRARWEPRRRLRAGRVGTQMPQLQGPSRLRRNGGRARQPGRRDPRPGEKVAEKAPVRGLTDGARHRILATVLRARPGQIREAVVPIIRRS